MTRKIIALLITAVLLYLGSVAYAQIPGYEYMIPVVITNNNPYHIHKYPVVFDINLAPYTQSDYNDIRIAYVGAAAQEIEINYSKELLGNGIVRIYAYVPEIPASSATELRVYVGNPSDTDHSIPKTSVIGEYLAVRFRDSNLGGDTWTPAWTELSSCTSRYWLDGGRDAFDRFLYPVLTENGTNAYPYVSPYAACNPYYLSIGATTWRYENFAYGYVTYSDPHNPGATNQRIWVQELIPRCDARDLNNTQLSYRVSGNLGSDLSTYYWQFDVNTPLGITLRYHETSDDPVPDQAGTGDPQIHYMVVFGDGSQNDVFTLNVDDVVHSASYTGVLVPITYLLFVGDVHPYVSDWINQSIYLGEPCYIDTPLEVNIGSAVHLRNLYVIYPATIYRTHEENITIYYDGNLTIRVITDWNYEVNLAQVDVNTYSGILVADTNVTVGYHSLYVYEDNTLVQTLPLYVDYGGIPTISAINYQPNVMTGVTYTLTVTVSCARDICDSVVVDATATGCTILTPEVVLTNIPPNGSANASFDYVCYETGEYNIQIKMQHTLNSETNIITVYPYLQTTSVDVYLSAPDVVDPNAIVQVAVSVTNYDGNVTVTLLDRNFNPIYITEANKVSLGSYIAEFNLGNLDDGTYYIMAAGDSFTIVKVLVVSRFAFMNPYGILVEDEVGKPASPMYAEVNGEYIEYVIKLLNLKNSVYVAPTDEWLSFGGIFQMPYTFIDTIDTLTVTDYNGTTTYNLSYAVSGGAIAVVWSNDTKSLILQPGDNLFRLKMKSPYVTRLQYLYNNTQDPNILNFLQQALDANYVYQQAQIYLQAQQYIQSALYGGITVDVFVPPSAVQTQTVYGFIYIRNSAGNIDPTTIECNIIDETGNTISTCNLTKIGIGAYKVKLDTNTVGLFGVKVAATVGLYMGQAIAYYQVTSLYTPGEITVTNFVVPPNGTTTVIYAQDPVATVTISLYDTSGSLITSGIATYDANIGAFVYELNVGNVAPGDYIVVASDNFGYSDRAVIHVSPILEEILAYVTDINTFLTTVIDPKLDSIRADVNSILDGQQNLYQAIQDVNSSVNNIISILDQLEQNISTQHAELLTYLQELNSVAYQILNEILYIKNQIDNVVITKLDQVLINQSNMSGDLNDIKQMLDCNVPSAVCLQLNNIELLLRDINTDLSATHDIIISKLDTIDSKVNTLQTYVTTLMDMVDCNYAYPTTSLCAKLDTLYNRVVAVHDDLLDVNAFLNTIYDYIRNDLTNEVISVGLKVEDINNYLRGDIWNKLVDIYNQVNGLYTETNNLATLIGNHDAIVQAQLSAMMSYLQDVNTTLYNKIEQLRTELLPHILAIESNVTDILTNTETLKSYFDCNTPNELCDRLSTIQQLATDINTVTYEIHSDINEVRSIVVSEFSTVKDKLDLIDANVQELKTLISCDIYPTSPICVKLDKILDDTNNIQASLSDLNEALFDLFDKVMQRIENIKSIATGGGGGAPTITPIKVAYKAGSVYVAVPEYVPPGEYVVNYTGELYRYVLEPEPGSKIELDNEIISIKLRPDAKGVISGEMQLRSGSRVFRIKIEVIADERFNQKITAFPYNDKLVVRIPEGGAMIKFKGALSQCVDQDTMYIYDGGEYRIKLRCSADGVVEIIPLRGSMNQSTVQITVKQRPNLVEGTEDMLQYTILPAIIFLIVAFIANRLGFLV